MAKNRKRQRPPAPTVGDVLDALKDETDRGVVLIGSQWLQDKLESLLRTYFLGTSDAPEPLIESLLSNEMHDPPLGRSWPRLALCRTLGILGQPICDSIAAVQNLRNHYFAHYIGPSSLTDPHLQESLSEILTSLPNDVRTNFDNLKARVYKPPYDGPDAISEQWADFLCSVSSIFTKLAEREKEISKHLPNQRCRDRIEQRSRPPGAIPETD
jgi:hypothetical protein